MLKEFFNKNLLPIALLTFLLLSFVWLSYLGTIQTDKSYRANWWALSFSEPKEKSLAFVIENQSQDATFHWSILHNQKKVTSAEIIVKKGTLEGIDPKINLAAGKYSIIVSNATGQKEIAKNFE